MEKLKLGKTGLWVTKVSFGALPIQRVDFDTAKAIFRRAYEAGINYFDTARGYTDSEAKIGYSLCDVRSDIIISTKSPGKTRDAVLKDIQTSLKELKTDYVDLLQLHNPEFDMDYDNENSPFAGLMEAKKRGYCRFTGVTQHSVKRAMKFVHEGRFDTMQFPFSCLASDEEIALVNLCEETDTGFIAMKGMAGGMITNVPANFAFIHKFQNVAPIYGIQRLSELEQFIELDKNPPVYDAEMAAQVQKEREQLSGNFCRGCAYCMPCPQGINIPWDARISLMLKRAVTENFLTDKWQAEMSKIDTCLECGQCKSRCPYGLDTPSLLKENLKDYRAYLSANGI